MHNVSSPDNSDAGIERLIQAKGKTAPRIVPAAIKEVVVSELYFTGADGWAGEHADRVSDHGEMARPQPYHVSLPLLTICVLVLKDGFTVIGTSACASPENFDAEIGRRIARENAEQQIWPLLGYELKTKLASGAI